MEQADRIITVYIKTDEAYKAITQGKALRRRGFAPGLSDAEVLTMEIIGEMEGKNGDRAIWRYFNRHWRSWFPRMPRYKTFAKQCANLCWIKEAIMQHIFPIKAKVHIIDGIPMPVCHKVRARRARMLDTYTAWGFCAAKDEHYYGLRGHLVMNTEGFITQGTVTPAHENERSVLGNLIGHIKGMLIGDKGFIDQSWKTLLAQHGIDFQTPLRRNMIDQRPPAFVKALIKTRKSIETAFSVLVTQFSFTKIKAHNLWHFLNKFSRKILAFNFYILFKS